MHKGKQKISCKHPELSGHGSNFNTLSIRITPKTITRVCLGALLTYITRSGSNSERKYTAVSPSQAKLHCINKDDIT
eukprot:Gb_28238 [translate_table: standard]